jgi:N-acetylmuramic acid 6-phosphate etherase
MNRVALHNLGTEQINDDNRDLDLWSPFEIVTRMSHENAEVVRAVEACLPEIAQAVGLILDRLSRGERTATSLQPRGRTAPPRRGARARRRRAGGRLIYVGAGTSGRLGVLDASECPPTFGVPPGLVRGIIAGGRRAVVESSEGAEDDALAGARDLAKLKLREADVVVGIAASGRTPYVVGALKYARRVGAARIALVNTLPSPIAELAEIVIAPITGPESVSGSTRLKAGTAQKMVLNMLTTAAFVRLGKVYRNLMVDVQATNAKLKARAVRILCEATGMEKGRARKLLPRIHWEVKTGIVMELAGVSAPEARRRLKAAKGYIRAAVTLK